MDIFDSLHIVALPQSKISNSRNIRDMVDIGDWWLAL
jgi:hypothetical protein